MANINIVIGPPCAGKSAYVQANAKDGNVIVDFDLLAGALGSRVSHDSSGSVRVVALRARFSAINRILDGVEDDAWCIHTSPQKEMVKRYVDAGASFLIIDPGVDVCLERAEGRPEGTSDAIEAWYANPPDVPNAKIIGKSFAREITVMNRAYSILNIKAMDAETRTITGLATTPEPDRMGDIVEPLGVKFRNPLPLLWQHRHDQPVGHVKFDKPTAKGITFTAKLAQIDEPGALKDLVDMAWQSVKARLVQGVSIGFRALEHAFMDDGGIRFLESEVIELSLVTIPANASATIHTIKAMDRGDGVVLETVERNLPDGAVRLLSRREASIP